MQTKGASRPASTNKSGQDAHAPVESRLSTYLVKSPDHRNTVCTEAVQPVQMTIMKCKPLLPLRLLLAAVFAAFLSAAQGATLNYNPENFGWFDTGNQSWGVTPPPYNTNWTSGDSAILGNATVGGGTYSVIFDQNTTVGDVTTTTSGNKSLSSSGTNIMTLNNGTIQTDPGGGLVVREGATIQGNYTKAGNGTLAHEGSTGKAAYVGTATINAGTIYYSQAAQLGASSNFVISGGTLLSRQNTLSAGSVVLNSGALSVGRPGTSGASGSLTVTSFSGAGGTVGLENNTANTSLRGFTVNQATNTTFAGNIEGVLATTGSTQRLQFTKSGTGNLTLSGTVTLGTLTTVSGGTLLINGNTTNFSDVSSTTAISVTAGTLAGTGTITITGGDNVVLGAAGKLTAGLESTAGLTTYNFSSGGSLDLTTATASANTGWLKFELGSDALAGTSYDQINLLGGSLNIGTGLNFSDFDFTALTGFGGGNYVLFQTPGTILGSLGTTTGTVNGFNTTLSISGNNLVMNVVPEPSSLALLGGALLLTLVRRRCRQSDSR